MSLIVITPPAVEPVSLAEAKLHLRVEHSADDTLIGALIQAARERAEHETGRALITQTLELVLDEFPAAEIELARAPLQSITSVRYRDTAGDEQTLAAEDYTVDSDTEPGYVFPVDQWPDTYDGANAVRVRYTAGYADAGSDIPAAIRAWMLLQIGAAYRHRESFAAGVSVAELPGRFSDSLLDPYRTYR